jgi:hypothetical protein
MNGWLCPHAPSLEGSQFASVYELLFPVHVSASGTAEKYGLDLRQGLEIFSCPWRLDRPYHRKPHQYLACPHSFTISSVPMVRDRHRSSGWVPTFGGPVSLGSWIQAHVTHLRALFATDGSPLYEARRRAAI